MEVIISSIYSVTLYGKTITSIDSLSLDIMRRNIIHFINKVKIKLIQCVQENMVLIQYLVSSQQNDKKIQVYI